MLPLASAPPRSGGLSSSSIGKKAREGESCRTLANFWGRYGLVLSLACATMVWIWGTVRSHHQLLQSTHEQHHIHRHKEQKIHLPFEKYNLADTVIHRPDEQPDAASFTTGWSLPPAFDAVLERAKVMRQSCGSVSAREMDLSSETVVRNETFASLPSFGIIEALETWKLTSEHPEADEMLIDVEDTALNWQCKLPPETECDETKLTVIFMAYNPDRLNKLSKQVKTFLLDANWQTLISEVVLVWNGPRPVEESLEGVNLLKFAESHAFRVVYPLRRGLENDLMNRYHPSVVRVEQTKGILYYDDDGPFYSFEAVRAGFELWKRHPRAQMGAMARNFIDSDRQKAEFQRLMTENDGTTTRDQIFVSHCTNTDDFVKYDFHYFANFDAHMALPSGSMLHSNYLCFLWHPVLESIRQFVRAHPVHPDDVTVSMIVSQLAGRAPRTYSRRLNKPNAQDAKLHEELVQKMQLRRLAEEEFDENEDAMESLRGIIPLSELQRSRQLMFDINWDANGKGNKELAEMKDFWADLRTQAINTLVRYFGSLSGGSIGWCDGTPYYNPKKAGKCDRDMAKQGWLPWMNPDGSPKDTCP